MDVCICPCFTEKEGIASQLASSSSNSRKEVALGLKPRQFDSRDLFVTISPYWLPNSMEMPPIKKQKKKRKINFRKTENDKKMKIIILYMIVQWMTFSQSSNQYYDIVVFKILKDLEGAHAVEQGKERRAKPLSFIEES